VNVDAAERSTTPPARPAAGHLPGLDGLRAVAVLLVLGYHVAPDRVPGGFVGVDVFFVLSGFLITSLLLREVDQRGRVDLRRFWVRRFRRLAPAVVVTVTTVAAATVVVGHDTAAGLRSQVVGAFTWTSNWIQIHEGWDYADRSVPPLFNHLWSLAIEEQFYLLWPLLFLGLITLFDRAGARRVALTLAFVSAVLMAVWFVIDNPSRAYFGLDSHSFGLLLGAAIALGGSPHLLGGRAASGRQIAGYTVSGLLSLALIGLFAGTIAWEDWGTFLGGLALVNLAAGALVLAVANPTPLARLLGWLPLRWLGERSYGVYLWHWPLIIMVTRLAPAEHAEIAAGIAALVSVVIAAASYRFVETPMRRDGIGATLRRWARELRGSDGGPSLRTRVLAVTATVVCMTAMSFALWNAPAESEVEKNLRAGQNVVADSVDDVAKAPKTDPKDEADPGACRRVKPSAPLSVFGDSVSISIAPRLIERRPGSAVVAEVGWQYQDVARAIREASRAGRLQPAVLIATGTNGKIDVDDLNALLANELADRQVGLVAPYVPGHEWSDQAVAAARSVAERHDQVHLVDWHGLASKHPEVTAPDNVHPTAHGAGAFLDLAGQALARC